MRPRFSREEANHDQENDEEYDGNVFEIFFDRDRWYTALHLLAGNLWPKHTFALKSNHVQMLNAILPFLGLKYNRRTKSIHFTGDVNRTIVRTVVYSTGALLLLVGYVIYRYLYLKRRYRRMDRVDIAMKNRFSYLSSVRQLV